MSTRLYSVNKYMDTIATKLYGNQTLCKYLYYDEANPLSQPDIADTTILYTDEENQKILFNPFISTLDDLRASRLAVVIEEVSTDSRAYFKLINLDFIICCHNELWKVTIDDGTVGVRPLLIWDELDSLFVRYTSKGIGSDTFSYSNLIYFNEKFSGYKVCYKSISLPI